jgi:hypothetical protein
VIARIRLFVPKQSSPTSSIYDMPALLGRNQSD